MARSAYGAFFLQGIVLIALMIALRPIGVPAEVKALLVAASCELIDAGGSEGENDLEPARKETKCPGA
ncbi:MAG TPA: hypothetical protein VF234_09040 [Limnochordia bacterium]|jgi:hypothetical protein